MSNTVKRPEDISSSTVGPGEKKNFQYFGEFIPYPVLIENLDTSEDASFIMQGYSDKGELGWSLYHTLKPGETATLFVNWPGRAQFTNQGIANSSILVYGEGIFPEKS